MNDAFRYLHIPAELAVECLTVFSRVKLALKVTDLSPKTKTNSLCYETECGIVSNNSAIEPLACMSRAPWKGAFLWQVRNCPTTVAPVGSSQGGTWR